MVFKCCHFQLCDCSPTGSRSQQCDKKTGQCSCQEGYAGLKCDSCSVGYHGYSDCRACGCLQAGVIDDTCEANVCECDGTGQCLCKVTTLQCYPEFKKNIIIFLIIYSTCSGNLILFNFEKKMDL